MKMTIPIMLITVCFAYADVSPESIHKSDMQILDAAMADSYSGVDVKCVIQDGNVNIEVLFDSDYTGSVYQAGQIGYVLGAIGYLSRGASWHSDFVFISFRDMRFICSITEAEYFYENADEMSLGQASKWILDNLTGEGL